MATVRKRKLPSGLVRWQASYVDGSGKRRAKLFERKSDGEAWLVETSHDLKRGLHTPAGVSPTPSTKQAHCGSKGATKRVSNARPSEDMKNTPTCTFIRSSVPKSYRS